MTYDEWDPIEKALVLLAERKGFRFWYNIIWEINSIGISARKCHICNQSFDFIDDNMYNTFEAFQEHGIQHLKESGLLMFI